MNNKVTNAFNDAIPPELFLTDKRNYTSPENGKQGGRPAVTKPIADLFIEAFPHIKKHRGRYYNYEESTYRSIDKDDLNSTVMGYLRENFPDYANKNMQSNIIEQVNSTDTGAIPSKINLPCWNDLTPAPGWLATKNKLINVEKLVKEDTDAIQEHTPELISTLGLNYDYDPTAECPKWLDYLSGVQPEQEIRDAIQMLFGLSLIPDTSFDVFFIFYGESGTGKTVCLEVLTALINPENVCCLPLSKLTEKHSSHLLTENLLNIVGDLPTAGNKEKLSHVEGSLKDVASGALVPVERKGIDPIKAPAIARCIFATNSLPNFADRSGGIWDRIRIIPFDVKFRNTDKQNPNLSRDIIKKELPGILNWAIEGLRKLQKLNYFPDTKKGKELADTHRLICDHEREFLEEFYIEELGSYITKQDLYNAYSSHCKNNGYYPKSQGKFNQEVKRIFPKAIDVRKVVAEGHKTIWENISIR